MKATNIIIATLAMVASAYADVKINVLGAVNRQGHFVIKEGQVTLLDAIGLAEGLSDHGDNKKILIRKAGEEATFIEVDLMEVIRGKAKVPILNDGDLVYISEKRF